MDEDLESLFYKVIDQLGGSASSDAKPLGDTSIVTTHDLQQVDRDGYSIPLGVSNHHIHLSQNDADYLFGKGYPFQKLKDLSQPGQYALQECVTLAGPKGVIEKVRILGPVRDETQVEITATDCFKLGVKAPLRLSGDIENTPGCTVIGPTGSIQLEKGCIVAKRHIHMSPEDAKNYGVTNNQEVSLELPGDRGGLLKNVTVRVKNTFSLECHLDTEEANAMGVTGKDRLRLIK
ncbi:phosphate propanoyltransferase [Streptococcus hongkongensis]|nr:phosphate propanoyltransferase [Streptococcus uberis]